MTDILDRRRDAAMHLCDLGLPAVAIRYGVAYAAAKAWGDRCGLPGAGHFDSLLAAELHHDPAAAHAAERITPAAQERIRGLIDQWWVPMAPAPTVSTLIPRGLTAELVGRAARELAADRGGWSASVLYCGALAEAEHRGVDVATVIAGHAELVTARAEIVDAAERGAATCADLAEWLLHPAVWAAVIERAGTLAAAERIGAEARLELAS